MSFLAGLLRRELPTATDPSGTAAIQGTTAAPSVVPRLASRFENPGAPRWPGSGQPGGPGSAGDNTTDFARFNAAAEDAGTRDGRGTRPRDSDAGTPRHATGTTAPGGTTGPAGQAAAGTPTAPADVPAPAAPALHHGNRADSRTEWEAPDPGPFNGAAQEPGFAVPAIFSPVHLLQPSPGEAPSGTLLPARAGEAGHPVRQSGVVHGTQGMGEGSATPGHPAGDGAVAETGREAVRPRLEPLPRHEPARAPEQHIHVSIGRIEVRAVTAPNTPQRPTPPAPSALMSLDDYLKDRP